MKECDNMEIVELKDVDVTYDAERILTSINMRIEKGEYVLIVGPNGSGKSTLIRTILGLVPPLRGDVILEGTEIKKFSNWSDIGYVAQRSTFYNFPIAVTVEEMLQMTKDNSSIEERESVLAMVNMKNFLKKPILSLSGGQQQRILIARALLSNPQLLILDEPTVGLDQQTIKEFYQLIFDLHQSGKTILMVTHDMHLLSKEATRIIEINRKIIFDGDRDAYLKWHQHHNVFSDV